MARLTGMVSLALIAAVLAFSGCTNAPKGAAVVQRTYDSPEDAVVELISAARVGQFDGIVPIFGPRVTEMDADRREETEGDLQRLAAAYDRKHGLVSEADGSVTLEVGENDWEFPAPLIRENGRWRFDTDTGVEVVRERRIDRNEGDTIGYCGQFVVAQRQFYQMDADGNGIKEYACRMRSTPGKRDGLYWSDDLGSPRSPLGPLAAAEIEAGNVKSDHSNDPFHGYWYKILTAQGPGAPGGAKSYFDATGHMTGGFAVLAWPGEYGVTGRASFICGPDGIVYERDFGAETDETARSMTTFDPAAPWKKAD